MPITVEEKKGSPTLGSNTATIEYIIRGTPDEVIALSNLESTSPATYNGMPRSSYSVESVNDKIWFGTSEYATPSSSSSTSQSSIAFADGQMTSSFSTSGSTSHISQSILTTNAYGKVGANPSPATTDFEGAIGVNEGNIDGVDIATPIFNYSEQWKLSPNIVDGNYAVMLGELTGSINNAAFKTFGIGEVLFLGATGQFGYLQTLTGTSTGVDTVQMDSASHGLEMNDEVDVAWAGGQISAVKVTLVAGNVITLATALLPSTGNVVVRENVWDMTYNFAIQKTETNKTIGAITGITKVGWEYLWVRYKTIESLGLTKRQPEAVYTEQVYPMSDFSLLGIGV